MRLRRVRLVVVLALLVPSPALAWTNGQPGSRQSRLAEYPAVGGRS